MSGSADWAEALKITPENLNRWSIEAPPDVPLVVWCLEQGHVPHDQYLEWACEHFGLPILRSDYFGTQFDLETLRAERSNDGWSPWFFPIGKWDDVTFIACAVPPSEPPTGLTALVLADPAALRRVWENSAPTDDAAAAETVTLDAPAGVNLNSEKTFVLNLDGLNLVDDEHPPQATAPQAPPPPEPVAPKPVAAKPKAPPVAETTSVTLSVVTDIKKPSAPPVKAQAENGLFPPAPPEPVKRERRTFSVQPTLNADEEALINSAFAALKNHYQTAVIMKCTDITAKPYKWPNDLQIEINDSSVNLSNPSFLRIVAKTLQPYHGYVIESPVHQAFFESLKMKTPPACVTAIPIRVKEKLWGMLLAFGDKSVQGPEPLEQASAICTRLVTDLESVWGQAA